MAAPAATFAMDVCGWGETFDPTQWVKRVQTSDATVTTLIAHDVEDNTVSTISVTITARDTTGAVQGSFVRRFRVFRQGGGAATLGMVQTIGLDDVLGGAILIVVDTDGANVVRIRVVGLPATTIDWIGFAEWIFVP